MQHKYLLIEVTVFTILLPTSVFFLLKSFGKVDSIMISDLSQRKFPLIIQITLIFILIEKSITIDSVPELYFFFLGGLISALIAFILLFYNIKASIHMIGITILTAFIIGLSYHKQINSMFLFAFLIMVNLLVASSRLEMKAHTIKELIIGFISGLLPQMVLWYFWL